MIGIYQMKKYGIILLVLLFSNVVASCNTYDDSALLGRIAPLEKQAVANAADIAEIREMLKNAAASGIRVTVIPEVEGFRIIQSNGTEFLIPYALTGEKGEKGEKGDKGYKGDKGDSQSAAVTIEEDDAAYIFTIEGVRFVIQKSFAIITERISVDLQAGESTEISYKINLEDNTTGVFAASATGCCVTVNRDKHSFTITASEDLQRNAGAVISAIKNSTGEQASQYISINAPSASFSAENSGYASLMGTVSVSVRNAGGESINISWGDGITVTEDVDNGNFEHKYSKAGTYTVNLSGECLAKKWTLTVGGVTALSEAVPSLAESNNVWVMSHRAHTSDPSVPENSVASVNAAVAAGADVLETDTHITSDGEVVICHDQTINATTDGKGDITGMTLAQIKSYNLKDRNGKVTKEKMPTLEEFLLAARGRVYVNLDYSPRTASTEQVWAIVKKLGMEQEVLMYCNSVAKIDEVFACDAAANAYCRVDYYSTLLSGSSRYFVQARWKPGRPDDVIKDMENTAKAVSAGCLSSANMLHVNDSKIPEYTVNVNYLNDLLGAYPHCHMIMTDCPDILTPMLESKNKH